MQVKKRELHLREVVTKRDERAAQPAEPRALKRCVNENALRKGSWSQYDVRI
jgi:hypothetical protein